MADEFLTEEQARDWLRAAIAREGTARRFAKRAGVSTAFISRMLHGHPISGKVAVHLGLKKVNGYELTKVIPSPEQERYENSRRLWREQNPSITREQLEAASEQEDVRNASGPSQTPAK